MWPSIVELAAVFQVTYDVVTTPLRPKRARVRRYMILLESSAAQFVCVRVTVSGTGSPRIRAGPGHQEACRKPNPGQSTTVVVATIRRAVFLSLYTLDSLEHNNSR
eukprot:scaffold13343_cov78-Skeletonema_dohrnii-CCMP3373.AAC.2